MEREIKTIKTPSEIEVELKAWLTGREMIAIQSVYTEDLVYKQGEDFGIKGDKITQAKYKTIENIVVSVNGVKENILDSILDMRAKDYNFVIAEIDKITGEEEENKKKQ